MNQRAYNSTIEQDSEKLAPIIEAIIEGKYSWACVLLLRTIGYNPLHYIPYRTYNRLVKENYLVSTKQESEIANDDRHSQNLDRERSQNIRDLPYTKSIEKQHQTVRGGSLVYWLTSQPHRHSSHSDSLWEEPLIDTPKSLRLPISLDSAKKP